MSSRITEKDLMMKLLNHNAWTKGSLLDIDSLGAGGGNGDHLIFFNTQEKLGPLMSPGQLWYLIDSIGTYEYNNGLQIDSPNKVFLDEYTRLGDGGKLDSTFMYNLAQKEPEFLKIVMGKDFKESVKVGIVV